jgi:hypothetical protein
MESHTSESKIRGYVKTTLVIGGSPDSETDRKENACDSII